MGAGDHERRALGSRRARATVPERRPAGPEKLHARIKVTTSRTAAIRALSAIASLGSPDKGAKARRGSGATAAWSCARRPGIRSCFGWLSATGSWPTSTKLLPALPHCSRADCVQWFCQELISARASGSVRSILWSGRVAECWRGYGRGRRYDNFLSGGLRGGRPSTFHSRCLLIGSK